MDSIKQFFSFMNDIDYPYVVLRNFDRLPYDFQLGEHGDLDLLVYDFSHFFEIFPRAKLEYSYPRVRTKIPIDETFLYADVRHVGDGYYPEDFERCILRDREWNDRGFWTPNATHHGIALAYHAVHHKNKIAHDYRRWLGDATVTQLLYALKASSIGWVEPKDHSVGRFNAYWKGATSVVLFDGNCVVKEQTKFASYNLLDNEQRILSLFNSVHFPQVIARDGNRLTLEYCGVPLLDILPENWESQMMEILDELNSCGVQHRDIRLENFTVKDGIIKLIDFGWAKLKDEKEEHEPPSCLGFPNKPSYGFDDAYSIRSVIKQIQYQIEEKHENSGD